MTGVTSGDRRWLLVAAHLTVPAGAAATLLLPGRPLWPFGAACTLWCGVLTTGVASLRSGIFGPVVIRGAPGQRQLALTFDDGPDPESTLRVADLLEGAGHRGTFFVVGRRAARHPEVVAEIAARGHDMGPPPYNHTLRHTVPGMRWLREDFARTAEAVSRAAGRRPRYYRPPVGLLNPRIVRVAGELGLSIIGWSVRGRDGVATDADRVARRLIPGLRDGAIALLHDRVRGAEPAALGALPAILDHMDREGLRGVSLSRLLDAPTGPAAGGSLTPPRR